MSEQNYSDILCSNISAQRKKLGLTQDALAGKLGVTFQAVSKWENGQSCPDIDLLPKLADIFSVSIDELFGRSGIVLPSVSPVNELPWQDDGKIRAVVYIGRNLAMKPVEEARRFTFEYCGEAKDVISSFSLECGDVNGNVSAAGTVNCGDVEGNVSSAGAVTSGDVEGNASGVGPVTCGDVEGNVTSCNGPVTCGDVSGNIDCKSGVTTIVENDS